MPDKTPRMTPEQIINFVVSNGRLAGQVTDEETLEIVRKIAYGEMSDDEVAEWTRMRITEIRSEAAKERLKLKYLPLGFDFEKVDEYERYLSMSDDEQKVFVADMSNDEYEVWNALETARALYQDPVDRYPGSITEDKVERYSDRYGWTPE